MKTIKILSVFVLLFVGISVCNAKVDSLQVNTAVEEITKEFKNLYKGMPFDEILCRNQECSISICFKVTNDGFVDIIHIIGKNNDLVDYSKNVFSNAKIKADNNIFDGEAYWIKMTFLNKSF